MSIHFVLVGLMQAITGVNPRGVTDVSRGLASYKGGSEFGRSVTHFTVQKYEIGSLEIVSRQRLA